MAAVRTQIYLSSEQRSQLDSLREARGASLAELIRDAIDGYLDQQALDPRQALERTFGAAPEFEVASRSEWAARERRLGVG